MSKGRGSTQRGRGERALLETLVEVRKEAGLTQRALAARLRLPRSYVSKVEVNERRISPVECVRWSRACKAAPIEFFRRFVERFPVRESRLR